jgi:hypothetical protein
LGPRKYILILPSQLGEQKTKQGEVLLEDIGCINTPTSPTGSNWGEKQNGMGEDEILYSIESRGIFCYFIFSVDVEIAMLLLLYL